MSLPQIQVQIEQNNQWAFSQNQTLDGIKITVKAEKGVFPEGAFLHAKKVNNTEDKEKIQSAISEEVKAENSAKTVTKLVSFDITITDAEGNELQPDTSKGEVKVSFAQLPMVTEAATSTQELKVFHMDDTLSTATKLDTTVNEETKSVEATAEHFSLYTVAMLTATAETGEASVTDSADTVTYYDTIEEAILVAQSKVNSTVKLLKDAGTESPIQITTGSFILDLNGKTMTYTDASGRGTTAIEMKSGAKLSVKDSVGNGGITAANARNSITAGSGCTLTLYAGSYTGIDTMPELVSSALAEGVDFENLDNTDEWISRATIALLNMQHVGNVRVGKMPAAVEVSEQGGGVHYYDTITEAISGAISLPESTLKLNKDISLNSELRITGGTFNFDLNGHTLTFTGSGNVMLQQGASITFKDSVGTGKISNSSIWATIYIQGDANAKLQGGTYENAKSGGEGINVLGDRNIGDLLVEGYIYRNLSDNAYISDTSSYKIGSVKVVPAPLKITNQPQDKTVQFDYTELPTFTVGFSKTVTENPTFKWYSVGTGTGGADEAMDGEETAVLAVEAGKSAGQYKYFCG